jgi:hypothetical protein
MIVVLQGTIVSRSESRMHYLGQNFIFSLVIGCYLQMPSLFLSCLDFPIAHAERLTVRVSKMLHWLYFLGDLHNI